MKHLKTFENFTDTEISITCPTCKSQNVSRIAGSKYECVDCGDVFDAIDELENTDIPAPSTIEELEEYRHTNIEIDNILNNAKKIDQVLADQLSVEAEMVNDLDEFLKIAKRVIMNIKNVDENEANLLLNELMLK